MQLVKDFEDVDEVNRQLEKMGYNIGVRLIDEFLAKSGATACQSHRETAEVIAKVAFKMFLGISADVTSWNAERNSFCLVLYENPLTEFVELPDAFSGLLYSNILCGALRGALEMILLQVRCKFLRDTLRGDDVNEIQVEILEVMEEQMGDDYKDNT
jgi:trafficking protein particle complex subunit 3